MPRFGPAPATPKAVTTPTTPTQASQDWQAKKQSAQEEYLSSLEDEAKAAAGAPEKLRQAAIDTIANTRAQTGKVLAQGRGMLGGGRGLALLQQAAQDRGLQEGATQAQFSERIQQAVQDAARARSEMLSEKGKAFQLEQARGASVQRAHDEAVDIGKEYAQNQYYMSDDDYNEVANLIRKQASYKTDPAEQQAMLDYADKVARGEVDFADTIG